MLSHDDMEAKLLSDPSVKAEYDRLDQEYAITEELLRARIKAGLSQADVAEKMGTKAPAVCRIESADKRHSPSVRTLQKYAEAVGCKLEIRLIANNNVVREKP
jgi:transcriptional regulator with XRE-family HTH domain